MNEVNLEKEWLTDKFSSMYNIPDAEVVVYKVLKQYSKLESKIYNLSEKGEIETEIENYSKYLNFATRAKKELYYQKFNMRYLDPDKDHLNRLKILDL